MGGVTFYERDDCRGPSARLYWNPLDLDGGQYNNEDVVEAGLEDNTVSSVQVPRGYTAILYYKDGLNNEMISIKGWYEHDLSQELGCMNLYDIKDKISSVRIVKD